MNLKKLDRYLLPLLFIILLAFWWPTKELPYWWDSAGLVMQNAQLFLSHNLTFGPGLLDTYAHPPFLSYIIAVCWKLFGQKLIVSHIVNLFFAFLLILYTYLLAQHLTTNNVQGKIIGVLTSILLLFTPVFLAQIGIIYLEIPGAAFALASIYYFMKKKQLPYLISATLMLFIKEVFVFIPLTIILFLWAKEASLAIYQSKKFPLKSLLFHTAFLVLPAAIVSVWFIYHKLTTGWFFTPPDSSLSLQKFVAPEQIITVFNFFFLEQGRVVITAVLLILIEETTIRERYHKDLLKGEVVLLFLVILATVFFFGITEFLHRYIIVGLPFFYLLFFYLLTTYIQRIGKRDQLVILSVTMIAIGSLFYSQWNLHRKITTFFYQPLEDNLEYLDVIALGQATSKYLEKNFPKAKIATAFPATYMFTQPYQGYVKKPLISKSCARLKPKEIPDIIVFHPFSPISPTCLYNIELYKFKPYRNFERNGKFISIYQKKPAK